MGTALKIDEEVLNAAKKIARRQHRTAGAVISGLARRDLTQTEPAHQPAAGRNQCCSLRPFATEGRVVSNYTVERLRQREDI